MAWHNLFAPGRRPSGEKPKADVSPAPVPVDPNHPLPRVKRVELPDGTVEYREVPSVAPPQRTTPAPATRGGLRDPDRSNQLSEPPWGLDADGWRF